MIIAGVAPILVSVLLIWSVEAAARGTLRRNGWIGLRFGSFMDSEEAWRAGHAAGRTYIWIGCLLLATGGVMTIALPASETARGDIILGAFLALFAAVAAASVVGNRAASRADIEARQY